MTTPIKVNRNLDVSENDLSKLFLRLGEFESIFINEAKVFWNIGGQKGHVHTMDLFTSAIINRSISLMRGFVTLAKENNYIADVPLIRIQLDNSLRFYASTIVPNYNDFFSDYLSGKHIKDMKDSEGNKMSDNYLIKKLDLIFPGVHNLYINTSSHIHFSNQHSFIQTSIVPDKERTIRTS